MGLIAAFGFIICFGVLFDISRRCATWATRLANVESPSTRRRLFASTFLSVAVLGWLIPNFGNIRDQWEMNKVSADCGWKEYKLVEQVDGIYFEDTPGNPPG